MWPKRVGHKPTNVLEWPRALPKINGTLKAKFFCKQCFFTAGIKGNKTSLKKKKSIQVIQALWFDFHVV
jgi:hypothetical protein